MLPEQMRSRQKGNTPICLFLGDLSGGGAERMMVVLANGLAKEGLAVDLLLARSSGPYLAEVSQQVNVLDLAAARTLHALPKLVSYLREHRPLAMLTTLHHNALLALAARYLARTGTPVFIREANTMSRRRVTSIRGKAARWLSAYSYYLADAVVAVSSGVAEDLRRTLPRPAKRIELIYNPIVGPALEEKSREEVQHPWFGQREEKIVLAAGRLTAQKDFGNLIRAFAELRQELRAKLVILGEGEERRSLERLVSRLQLDSHVDLPGFVPNPFAYMARSDLFVLSSRWEGMPAVLVQAMACGCAVVSTDCPSGPSEVLLEGRLGQLVPVGDSRALAVAMKRALLDPGSRSARIERAGDFSEQASVKAYISLLTSSPTQTNSG